MDPRNREAVRRTLEELGPSERRTEPYCDYVMVFKDKPEKVVVRQYTKGTLTIQGKRGMLLPILAHALGPYIPEIRGIEEAGGIKTPVSEAPEEIPLPYIGTDESGKGDYFGPMVVAGVLLDETAKHRLEPIGIKDSKQLTDRQCRDIAEQIRKACARRYCEVVIPPERYNSLYAEFVREGKNLNHLLAWGHARAIETLLEETECPRAVADQFGAESYIKSRLMGRGKTIRLTQLHRGERYMAVAAASILARDRFLEYLSRLSETFSEPLPKGAAGTVIETGNRLVQKHGEQVLTRVAKLHHKTTEKIRG